ncbi:MAG TPA: aromatic amino acid ammonia-lyase [Verrucomicrobiae bacterium]|nr:aromatic amino acid ammonia-lyase [Verrucomicrobiae bacterium]
MIKLNGHNLSISETWQIASLQNSCSLADEARPLIRRSRELVENLAAQPRAIYGINTGFGPLSGFRVSGEDQKQHQLNLLYHLFVGQGALFSETETRAIMLARANTLARGFSGIREELLELLLAALNKNILPEIPSEGSVGASGDLVPLAHMAGLLVGIGYARVNGERLPSTEALKKFSLAPAVLQCKEGLALVNGTSVMTGLAALSSREAEKQLRWLELLTACLFQVLNGEPEVLCQQIHKARGFRGQSLVAQRISDSLRTHPDFAKRIDEHQWGTAAKAVDLGAEIQDPYSLRCAPQILGAFQEAHWHVEEVITRELNASTDNPLIFPDSGMVIHGGNFYGQQIAMVSDYERIGLIKMALLAERQIERLVNWRYSRGLPPMLAGGAPGLNSGFSGAQLLATSLAAEARLLGTPASIQTISTNANNQDVVSMGCVAAKMTRTMLPLLWKILAIEAITVVQAADLRGREKVLGGDFKKLYELVRGVSLKLENDRPLNEDIARVTALLQSESAQQECLRPQTESDAN